MARRESNSSSPLNDVSARKQIFEEYYSKLAAISQRYAKNQEQSEALLNSGLTHCLNTLDFQLPSAEINQLIETEFIISCIAFIKNIRSEYYVASTVHATETTPKNDDLFADNEKIDFDQVDIDTFIKAMQQLVPSQRLVFNLHVIDGFSLTEAGNILESSEPTVKSNIEKARYNLQKNIENCLKRMKV
jgi:RNA polymerase sigma-70 factor (ECF subfamily)